MKTDANVIGDILSVEGWSDKDGWIWYQAKRLIWLPFHKARWRMGGVRMAVWWGDQVFIFDISGIMSIGD